MPEYVEAVGVGVGVDVLAAPVPEMLLVPAERFELRKNRPLLKFVHYATNYTACVLKCKSKFFKSGGFAQ